MSLPDPDTDSSCTVWSKDHEYFDRKLVDNVPSLLNDVLHNVIRPNSARLRAADTRYRLDDLLSAMLEHAPHPSGQRYVAVSLYVAHQKGEDGVVNAAKAWLDNLILPSLFLYISLFRPLTLDCSVLAVSKAIKIEPPPLHPPAAYMTPQPFSPGDQCIQVSIMPSSSPSGLLNCF
jgi:hypothetical protein